MYFSDFFGVTPEEIERYGAFNISLISDLPLFVDPFLLFNSRKREYQRLHEEVIDYLRFLKAESAEGLSDARLKRLFTFPEVKQNWFGFSLVGNKGRGPGLKFARSLNQNLETVFNNFGEEGLTKGAHLEKVCLLEEGVGKDHVSDFATNLIKSFLCEYTERFAKKHIDPSLLARFSVNRAEFVESTKSWKAKEYVLPRFEGDFVLLTPIDMLTKDEAWISRHELIEDFSRIASALPNDQLRDQVERYLAEQLPEEPTKEETQKVVEAVLRRFPEVIDYYIADKEDQGDAAVAQSLRRVAETHQLFVEQVTRFIVQLFKKTRFYREDLNSHEAARRRVEYLKKVIEDKDGYRVFYLGDKPIKREHDLQVLFKLTWFASVMDVNAEVNNGRGPADFVVSRGSDDKTLVEFKLAGNTKLKQNLKAQTQVYESAAEPTHATLKVILFFSDAELSKVRRILKELKLEGDANVILIDARPNKPSGSVAR